MGATRRTFLAGSAATAAATLLPAARAQEAIPRPPENPILFSCKLSMVAKSIGTLEQRFAAVKELGYDGLDMDEAGNHSPEEVRAAVKATGLFVHNAINHKHWDVRHTSAEAAARDQALENLKHCIRVSHAAGGNGVLLVIGTSKDGPEGAARSRESIARAIPLAASLGQRILFENVWNGMFYQDDGPPDQKPDAWIEYIDSFRSPWVGLYFDIGNQARYCRPGEWIRALGSRIVKLDIKGYDTRPADKRKGFVDITAGDLDWAEVRKALADIGFAGWAAAEVRGGEKPRLAEVLAQMKRALLG